MTKHPILFIGILYILILSSCIEKKDQDNTQLQTIPIENYQSQMVMISNFLNYQMKHFPNMVTDSTNDDTFADSISNMINDPDGLLSITGNDQPLIIVDTFYVSNPQFNERTNEYTFDIVYPKSILCTVELELKINDPNFTQKMTIKEGRILIHDYFIFPTHKDYFKQYLNTQLSEDFEPEKIDQTITFIEQSL